MALSCWRLSSRLSLGRLSGLGTNRTTHGVYFPNVSRESGWLLCRQYTSSKVRRGIGRYVASRLQWANTKYEAFLKRRFPRFFQLYHTFVEGTLGMYCCLEALGSRLAGEHLSILPEELEVAREREVCAQGFKLLFQDAKEVRQIKAKMLYGGVKYRDLHYREMEKLRQFRRDLIKAIPLVMISVPPFANYLVFVLMYFFPRQLLIPHFWTPNQHLEFRRAYHFLRAQHHWSVLKGLENTGHQVKNGQLQGHLKDLCAKVQNGANPRAAEILAVRSLFSGPPLGIKRMSVDHMRHISPLLFLTPRLPGFLIGRRLNSHALELLQLDRALSRLGLHQLSDSELRQACYLRGINSDNLGVTQCREWLSQWLQVSSSLKESEVSLLLHCIVFLSANYPQTSSRPRQEA